MPELIHREHMDTDPIQCVKEHISRSIDDRKPVSRYGLASIVAEQSGMPMDQAQELVEAYCEEHAAYVPAYLGREFGLFWPRVMAVIVIVAGLSIGWYAYSIYKSNKPAYLWFSIATVVIGAGLFLFAKNLGAVQSILAERKADKEKRLREKYAQPR